MVRVPAERKSRTRVARPPAKEHGDVQTSRGRTIIAGAALVAMVLASYAYALRCDFIWDDDDYVTNNHALESLDGLRRIWFELGAVPQYYPLVHTTFWIERHLWGLDPVGFHAVNIALHAAGALLVWRLLVRLEVPGAWLAAALFAVHPVEVESVAWITERKNVLSLPLALLSLLAYLRFAPLDTLAVTTDAHADASAKLAGRWRWYAVSLALFVAAALSKTVVVTLPAVLLVIIWWKRGRFARSDLVALVPFFVVGLGLGLVTVWMERNFVGAAGEEWSLTPLERVLLAGRVLWFYAAKLVWPYPLAFFYPRFSVDAHVWWQYLFPLAAIAVIIALWRARDAIGRGPLAAVLIFAGVLAPALGFFDVYPFRFSFVADHFQYHAGIALLALAAAGLAPLLERAEQARHGARALFTTVLLVVLGVLTFCQTFVYYDLETLYADTIAKNPTSWTAYANLSMHYITVGRKREAYALAERALELAPEDALTNGNLAALLLADCMQGDNGDDKLRRATNYFQKSVAMQPANISSRKELGYALMKSGRYAEAEQQLLPALEALPDDARALYALGMVRFIQERWQEAADLFERSLRADPADLDTHHALADAWQKLGRDAEAAIQRDRAARLAQTRAAALIDAGKRYLANGHIEQATAAFARALHLEPDNGEARAGLDRAEQAANNSQP
jgi:tetratricopeptide (TPR) repeat protein